MNTETDYWLQIRLPACHRLLLMRMFLFWSAADSSRSSTFQSYSVWIFEIICSLVSSMFTFDRSPWIPKSDTLGTSLNYLLKLVPIHSQYNTAVKVTFAHTTFVLSTFVHIMYLSCYWPNFDQTSMLAFWDKL